MVIDYLEKIRDQYLQEKDSLKQKESELQNSLKEHIAFIQLLEDSNDPSYELFTPREVHGFQKKKIEDLKSEQNDISDELNQLKIEILDINCDIDEINSVLKVAKDNCPEQKEVKSPYNRKYSILETQEKERQRIARDLHDSTVQNLTSLVHKSELCLNLMDMDPVRCKLELSSLTNHLRNVINDIRDLIYDLRPMSFDDIGFDITVDRFLDKLNHESANFKLTISGEPYHISSVIALTLLRVIQEACSNAVHHGNASNVDIILDYCPGMIHLKIDDDGKGFDMNQTPDVSREDNSGFGLSMMKERIFLLSGEIKISSEPDNGFHIDIYVPIKSMEEKVC
jgi:two-component system sensor histidine kinase DegS